MLVELCASNYSTNNGLVNGANGIFQAFQASNSQKVIWILFNNIKSGQLTRTKNAHFYEHKIHPTWTPIESISKDIQIGSKFNSYYNKDVISYSISCKKYYYQAQGLTLDHLAFDPNGVYKQHFPILRTKNFLTSNLYKWKISKLTQVLP
jgi:hypothetical protein